MKMKRLDIFSPAKRGGGGGDIANWQSLGKQAEFFQLVYGVFVIHKIWPSEKPLWNKELLEPLLRSLLRSRKVCLRVCSSNNLPTSLMSRQELAPRSQMDRGLPHPLLLVDFVCCDYPRWSGHPKPLLQVTSRDQNHHTEVVQSCSRRFLEMAADPQLQFQFTEEFSPMSAGALDRQVGLPKN